VARTMGFTRPTFVPFLSFTAILFALFAWAPFVRAERELIVPFHEGGHLVVDQLCGVRVGGAGDAAYAGIAGVASRTTNAASLEDKDGLRPSVETSLTRLWLAPSVDVFVTEHLSVGGRFEVSHAWGFVERAGTNVEVPPLTSVTLLPRVGFYAPLADRLGLWPRVAIGYTTDESVAWGSSEVGARKASTRAMLLELEVAVVVRMTETFFLRAGPELSATLGGRQTIESALPEPAASASMVSVSAVVGLGANLEL
jgi:hypothetical protein